MAPPISMLNKEYSFIQTINSTAIGQLAITPNLGAFYFRFADLNQSSSFAVLFDQYKIDMIEATFYPMFRANAMVSVASIVTPLLYTAVDLDDATAPASIAALNEYSVCQCHGDDGPFKVVFKPHVAIAAYSGTFASFANQSSWIDVASTTVQHYGLKWGITPGLSGQTIFQEWNVNFRIAIRFKNVR